MTPLDLDHLKQWIGKTETRHDRVTLAPLQALAATLDRDDARPVPEDVLERLDGFRVGETVNAAARFESGAQRRKRALRPDDDDGR